MSCFSHLLSSSGRKINVKFSYQICHAFKLFIKEIDVSWQHSFSQCFKIHLILHQNGTDGPKAICMINFYRRPEFKVFFRYWKIFIDRLIQFWLLLKIAIPHLLLDHSLPLLNLILSSMCVIWLCTMTLCLLHR